MPVQLIQPGEQTKLFDANVAAAPVDSAVFAMPTTLAKILTWTTKFASAPSAVSILLAVSNDPAGPWTSYDTSTVTAGETRVGVVTSAAFLKATKTSQTGGGALDVILVLSH